MRDILDIQKQAAALEAVKLVRDGMVVGLGTGSTARHFVDGLAARMRDEQLKLMCVPTSRQTREQAERLCLPLVGVEDVPVIDLTVDGADEIGPRLSLVKGGGGALLREKIVANASHDFVIIADHSKMVPQLGAFPLPVEIIPFGWESTQRALCSALESLGLPQAMRVRQAQSGQVFKTDNGNLILDLMVNIIPDPEALAQGLCPIPGVVDHGLFLNMARLAFIAHPDRVEQVKH